MANVELTRAGLPVAETVLAWLNVHFSRYTALTIGASGNMIATLALRRRDYVTQNMGERKIIFGRICENNDLN
jgi:hypothetical protein